MRKELRETALCKGETGEEDKVEKDKERAQRDWYKEEVDNKPEEGSALTLQVKQGDQDLIK